MRLTRTALAAAAALLAGHRDVRGARAATGPIKVGLMLPYTGTYAALGTAIENGFKLYVAGAGRQARRPRDRVLQGRRRVRSGEGHRQRQQADQARQRRRARRHRALRRGDGDGQGREGQQHAADHSQRRRRRDHRPDVRAEHLPQLVLELAAGLRDGRGRGRAEGQEDGVTITWKYAAGDESVKRLQGRLREGRRQGRQGADPAVPERRVPGAADRDRGAQARRGLRLLRRRRRGQVRQGLRGGGPQQDDPAVRPGLPHRRHARGAGRVGAGHADDAALRRRPRHAEETTRSAPPTRKAYKPQPDVYAVQGYDAAQMLGRRPEGGEGRHREARRARRGDGEGEDRQPARHVHASARRTTRCRTSTCARSRATRTSSSASRSRRSPTRRAAASSDRAGG